MFVVYFLLGLIIGSFLNVLIVRRGVSLGGRSRCMSCGTTIAWYDNVPLISWIALRGRCRHCRSRISAQYPLVELLTGLLFALIGSAPTPPLLSLINCAIVALLVAIAIYDLRHTIIPDEWVYPLALLSLLSGFFSGGAYMGIAPYLLAGPVIALPLFLLWLYSRGAWMGLGDAKLCLGMGWLLGALWGFYALTLSFILGALISLFILLPLPYILRAISRTGIARLSGAHARFTMKSEVPFGPFLIASTLLVWSLLLYHVPLPL